MKLKIKPIKEFINEHKDSVRGVSFTQELEDELPDDRIISGELVRSDDGIVYYLWKGFLIVPEMVSYFYIDEYIFLQGEGNGN